MKIYEFCPHCAGEIELSYKGFKIHRCTQCKRALKPCSMCDAYTDSPKIAESCDKCPLNKGGKETK